MFVRLGNKEKAKVSSCMCAPCFESVMSELSDEFQGMKDIARPPAIEERLEEPTPLEHGPHCFGCGLAPEKCKCAWEAYR